LDLEPDFATAPALGRANRRARDAPADALPTQRFGDYEVADFGPLAVLPPGQFHLRDEVPSEQGYEARRAVGRFQAPGEVVGNPLWWLVRETGDVQVGGVVKTRLANKKGSGKA
jgi:hypothetical protein